MSASSPQAADNSRGTELGYGIIEAPFFRASEGARRIFLVTSVAGAVPLLTGMVIFGWRVLIVAGVSVASCALIERLYYAVTRVPALLGRSHAYLTGLLLALTLPADVPLHVPVIAGAFAIIVGKAIFGGVGHFLWQPALVGRLAVAVLFAGTLSASQGPVLLQKHMLTGDITDARPVETYHGWAAASERLARSERFDAQAIRLPAPTETLAGLTRGEPAPYSGLSRPRHEMPRSQPVALLAMPPVSDLFVGTRPGGIGETSALMIFIAGMYLVYRNYGKWQLPAAVIASAWLVAAIAPIQLAGPNDTVEIVWWPLLAESRDVGVTYVNYQILSGELMLAAFFFAPEMTSRPVTTGGQVIFGLGVGAVAMGLQLYTATPIPAYLGVLAMNTFTPLIDSLWRPRVMGQSWWSWLTRR